MTDIAQETNARLWEITQKEYAEKGTMDHIRIRMSPYYLQEYRRSKSCSSPGCWDFPGKTLMDIPVEIVNSKHCAMVVLT